MKRGGRTGAIGFTLLEILFAVTILSLVSTVTFMTFSAATSAWQRGTTLADNLHHGDYVIQQLVMGLRSAYYPDGTKGAGAPEYGFWHEDNGEGENAEDEICWVKLGGALVGRDSSFAETPHRVRFLLEDDEDGDSAAAVVACGCRDSRKILIRMNSIPCFFPNASSGSIAGRRGSWMKTARLTGWMNGRKPTKFQPSLRSRFMWSLLLKGMIRLK